MTTFLFSYRQPLGYVPGGEDTMAAWTTWMTDIADDLVERGNPVLERSVLGNCGTDTQLGGFSIVRADDLESAVAIAKGCPALRSGGGVEVGVIAEM